MSIDPNRLIAFHGIAGYDDWRKQPGRLGWGVGTKGYGPMVNTYLVPLVRQTNCRRIFLHKPWPDSGQEKIPVRGPIVLKEEMPDIFASFVPAFERLATAAMRSPDRLEVIQYHGAATQLPQTIDTDQALSELDRVLGEVMELARVLGHSTSWDMASDLPIGHSMNAGLIALRAAGHRVYMEQRPRRDQPYLFDVPTFTLFSEIQRQDDRGGEPSLAPFNPDVENLLGLDVCPPDRDPLESWDAWIVDEVQARQEAGFTVCVPIHSMVRRQRWDLLRQIFGEPK